MKSVSVNIPDAVLYDTKMTPESAEAFAKKSVALSYYTQRGVSLGYCAQIAGLSKIDFIRYLSENGVSIFCYDDDTEFIEESDNA